MLDKIIKDLWKNDHKLRKSIINNSTFNFGYIELFEKAEEIYLKQINFEE